MENSNFDQLFIYQPPHGKYNKKILQKEKGETSALIKSFRTFLRTKNRKEILEDFYEKYRTRFADQLQVTNLSKEFIMIRILLCKIA